MGPKTVNIRSICDRLDLPVEEVSGEDGSMLGTFHWAMIPSGGGDDGLFRFLFPCSPATNNHADNHHWAGAYSHHRTSAWPLLIQPISRL